MQHEAIGYVRARRRGVHEENELTNDLQMHLTGEDFAAACQTLARDFRGPSIGEIRLSFPIERHIGSGQERTPFNELAARYAVPNEANWPIARAYLVETRGIDPAIVDDLQEVGTIFANDYRPNPSSVFLHRTQHGKVEGATLRDTRNQSSFRPYLGNKLTAWFTVGHLDKAEIAIAVESPIDALSYRTIHACRGDAWAVVSCAGATVPDQLMRLAYKRRQRFVVALDNDRAGERGWRKTWDETDRSLPTLCGQTRVGWIHEHGSSETIGGCFLEPNARRRGFLKLVKGEGLHICQILETQAHSDFVSGAVKEFFSFG